VVAGRVAANSLLGQTAGAFFRLGSRSRADDRGPKIA